MGLCEVFEFADWGGGGGGVRLEVWCWGWCCCEGTTPVAAVGGGTKCTRRVFFFSFREEIHAGAGYQSFLGTMWVPKCNQATERGSTYARISAENFMTFKKRNLYPDTKEPACDRLLVLSFIRISNSTDLPERTILREF